MPNGPHVQRTMRPGDDAPQRVPITKRCVSDSREAGSLKKASSETSSNGMWRSLAAGLLWDYKPWTLSSPADFQVGDERKRPSYPLSERPPHDGPSGAIRKRL